MRCVAQDSESAYAQLTVRINSMHVFAAYGAKGRVMMGDPAQPIKVVDLWVFERSLSSKKSNKFVTTASELITNRTIQPACTRTLCLC